MLIVKKISKKEDGSYSSEWNLSAEQMSFLLTYAINALLDAGLVEVEEQDEDSLKQAQLDFLVDLDEERMYKA